MRSSGELIDVDRGTEICKGIGECRAHSIMLGSARNGLFDILRLTAGAMWSDDHAPSDGVRRPSSVSAAHEE